MTGGAAPDRGWAVVAGAAGALGRPIAEHLADAGWQVLALDRTPPGGDRHNVVSRIVDATDPAAVGQVLDEVIPARAPVRVLVNAIGIIWNEPFLSLRGAAFHTHDVDSWRRIIDANLTAPFVVAAHVVRRMARGGGSIVNFSSIAARGNAGQSAYSAAKAGVEGLTRAMAAELGPLGIRVNAVAPGFVDVSSTRAALTPDHIGAIVSRTPARRLGTIADIVAAVDFLLDNAFVTGAVLDVNGGCRLHP